MCEGLYVCGPDGIAFSPLSLKLQCVKSGLRGLGLPQSNPLPAKPAMSFISFAPGASSKLGTKKTPHTMYEGFTLWRSGRDCFLPTFVKTSVDQKRSGGWPCHKVTLAGLAGFVFYILRMKGLLCGGLDGT